MSTDKCDTLVAEYLHELEHHLRDLPVLQRRELVRDLEAHVANERADHPEAGEPELLDILERLGSPEAIAAAAYEEAGLGKTGRQPALAAAAGAAIFAGAAARFSGRAAVTPDASAVPAGAVSALSAATAEVKPVSAPAPPVSPSAPVSPAPDAAESPAPPASCIPDAVVPPVQFAVGRSASASVTPPPPTPEAYVPPAAAPVVPPPADRVVGSVAGEGNVYRAGRASARSRPGPFPPRGPGAAGRSSFSSIPPVAGPPMPPPTSGQGGPPWLGAVLAGGIALAVVLLLGCLGGALMIGRGESAEPVAVVPPDAVVSVEPEAPVNPADPVDPADPARTAGEGVAVDPPGSTETADAPQPTD